MKNTIKKKIAKKVKRRKSYVKERNRNSGRKLKKIKDTLKGIKKANPNKETVDGKEFYDNLKKNEKKSK